MLERWGTARILMQALWETVSTNDEKEVHLYVIQETCLAINSNTS